jgi:hypothetical protein
MDIRNDGGPPNTETDSSFISNAVGNWCQDAGYVNGPYTPDDQTEDAFNESS